LIAALLTLTTMLCACGGSEEQDSAPAETTVDPRFATAEALMEHFNTLNTRLPPDLPNLIPLYHIETDFQRKKLQVLQRSLGAPHDFEVAMFARFARGFSRPSAASGARAHRP
jgi:hypothetical protein